MLKKSGFFRDKLFVGLFELKCVLLLIFSVVGLRFCLYLSYDVLLWLFMCL
jgi:hypothetical protein